MKKKYIWILITITIGIIICMLVQKTESDNKEKTIYLTFDDGPSPVTEKILDLLKKENVKATFFVINTNDKYNYIIKRAFLEGHTIGLHSYSHKYSKIYKGEEEYFYDLNMIQNKVFSITGSYSNIIRFPGGSSNTISNRYNKNIMNRLIKDVTKKGYIYFDWNISSGDTKRTGSKNIYRRVISEFSKYNTNIILMHDYDNNYKTYNSLSAIIKYGKLNGYKFDKITDVTPLVRHKYIK